MLGEEERLQPEAVTGREEPPFLFVPDNEGELPAEPLQASGTQLLVEVERDLAVRVRAEAVAPLLESRADLREPVELAVYDDPQASVLARDRLKPLGIVDREERVAESRPSGRRDPCPGAVRAPVTERRRSAPESRAGNRPGGREDRHDAAHGSRGPQPVKCMTASPPRQVNRISGRRSPRTRSRLSPVTR